MRRDAKGKERCLWTTLWSTVSTARPTRVNSTSLGDDGFRVDQPGRLRRDALLLADGQLVETFLAILLDDAEIEAWACRLQIFSSTASLLLA